MTLNTQAIESFVAALWKNQITQQIHDYIKIPNQSPAFDPNWQANGHMEKALQQIYQWVQSRAVQNSTTQILRLENRTPLLAVDVWPS